MGDHTASFLHLGINYGWRQSQETRQRGDLFIVTNHMTEDMKNEMRVQPLLTENEVLGRDAEDSESSSSCPQNLRRMRQTQLGGCCCDCCHTHGCNCGRKFPDIPQLNQCLTPQLFNSLCRLGRKVSQEAVCAIGGIQQGIGRARSCPQSCQDANN